MGRRLTNGHVHACDLARALQAGAQGATPDLSCLNGRAKVLLRAKAPFIHYRGAEGHSFTGPPPGRGFTRPWSERPVCEPAVIHYKPEGQRSFIQNEPKVIQHYKA